MRAAVDLEDERILLPAPIPHRIDQPPLNASSVEAIEPETAVRLYLDA